MNGIDEYRNRIICGDNVMVMQEFPGDCIDLTVTSPPYDNLRDYKGYTFDFEGVAEQLFRITKPGGVVVWVVGDATIKGSETGTSFRQALHFKDIGFRLHDTMIYQKLSGGATGSNLCYIQSFEYMFVLSKGKPGAINLIYDRKNVVGKKEKIESPGRRFKTGETKPRRLVKRNEVGRRFNIWGYYTGVESQIKTQHPAIFPDALARDHIISWSNPGDLILDPMCGSGTTCKKAKELGRDYIGIDVSSEYCAITEKRIAFIDYYGKPTEALGSTPPINFMEMKGKDG